MFFKTKDLWYSIVTNSSDVDTGFRRLDSFFKSITTVLSNQLWKLVISSLSDFEKFFEQFSQANSEISLFIVHLGIQIRFDPPLTDLEGVIISLLDEIVSAVKDIPRIETKLFTSLTGESLFIPTITNDDDRIDEGRFYRRIVAKNTIAPQKYLTSYEKYKSLLNHTAEKRIEEFLHERHNLEDYEIVNFLIF